MGLDCRVDINKPHIRLRKHDQQAADELQESLLITPAAALSLYWHVLNSINAAMWEAGEKAKAGDRERAVVCIELRHRSRSAKLMVVLEKTEACLLVVTAYPHRGCVPNFDLVVDDVLRRGAP